LHKTFPSQSECIALLYSYVQQANVAAPASTSVRLRWYQVLKENDTVVLDGGNGEIARRQFFTLLKLKASKHIFAADAVRLFPHLLAAKPDFFTTETAEQMKAGAIEELAALFHMLPKPNEIGIETFLDFLALAIRIPNIACDEQARIDEHLLNFMPFSQPDFIHAAISLPLSERHNNRFFKALIQKYNPKLAHYPLVKNNISYPFVLTTLQARLWTAAKKLMVKKETDPTVHFFLDTMQEYILDTFTSTEVRNYDRYDYKKISHYVEQYFAGKKEFADKVNWWLAFDTWRRMVEK
jgi:hypothetical protein